MSKYVLLEGFHSMLPIGAFVPSEPAQISEGDYVKIGVSLQGDSVAGSEKFWGVVYAIDRDNWKYGVRINQDLRLTRYHGLSDGDELTVEFKHIVAVIK
ncbi:hypothetical protein H0088_004085 [Salmonella enterica]|nr:hypothetical protein [Salmonella enterica]